MAIWFTSDHHFGHARIIELARRPFTSVEAMDRAMIERWNARVAPDDLIYHLGDFAFSDHAPYLAQLKGQKRLVRGNHDHRSKLRKTDGWSTIDTMLDITVDDVPIVLCHYGLRVWNRSHHGALHFYGHSHGTLPGDSQCLDVGVDCWDFQPVSLQEIKGRLAANPKRQEPDHHTPRS
jgi:calcineurin-like phosphoesterase family protein